MKNIIEEVHACIIERAEWWRLNPDDSHGINKAVYVAMLEVANAINAALVRKLQSDVEKESR
jgi:hypothetical protein